MESNHLVLSNQDVGRHKALRSMIISNFRYESYGYCNCVNLAIPSLDLNPTRKWFLTQLQSTSPEYQIAIPTFYQAYPGDRAISSNQIQTLNQFNQHIIHAILYIGNQISTPP